MKDNTFISIQEDPLYKQITSLRSIIIWPLSIIILGVYALFILSLGFFPSLLAEPIGTGVTSMGILFGFSLIILTFILTGIYSYFANSKIEPMLNELRQKHIKNNDKEGHVS
jgi:uncharacterized membrane protein (DUF485 family)